jgi:hypothetical protein
MIVATADIRRIVRGKDRRTTNCGSNRILVALVAVTEQRPVAEEYLEEYGHVLIG